MDDLINRHNSFAEENIDPHGRPATNSFGNWSSKVADLTDDAYKSGEKEGSVEDREKRIKEMEEIIKKDLE